MLAVQFSTQRYNQFHSSVAKIRFGQLRLRNRHAQLRERSTRAAA
jgi:hypothetical protein